MTEDELKWKIGLRLHGMSGDQSRSQSNNTDCGGVIRAGEKMMACRGSG